MMEDTASFSVRRQQKAAEVANMVSAAQGMVFGDGKTAMDVATSIVLATVENERLKECKLHQPIKHQNKPLVPAPPLDAAPPVESVQQSRLRAFDRKKNASANLLTNKVSMLLKRIEQQEECTRLCIDQEQSESVDYITTSLQTNLSDTRPQTEQEPLTCEEVSTYKIKSFDERNQSHEAVCRLLHLPDNKLDIWRAANRLEAAEIKAQAARSANIERRRKFGGGNLRIRKQKKNRSAAQMKFQEYKLRIMQNRYIRNYDPSGVHVLFGAAIKGDVAAFQKHLSITTSLEHVELVLEIRDRYLRTPLHFAAYHNHINVLHFCHSSGVRPSRKDATNRLLTILHYAILGGHITAVEYIMKTRTSKEDQLHELFTETAEGLRASELACALQFNNIVHYLRGLEKSISTNRKGTIYKMTEEQLGEVKQKITDNTKETELQTMRAIEEAVANRRNREEETIRRLQKQLKVNEYIKATKEKALRILRANRERTDQLRKDRAVQAKERKAARDLYLFNREVAECSLMMAEDFRSMELEAERIKKGVAFFKRRMKNENVRHFGLDLTDSQRVNGNHVRYDMVMISSTSPPASTSAIKPGDLIHSINGIKVRNIRELKTVVGKAKSIELTVLRGAKHKERIVVSLTAEYRSKELRKYTNTVTTSVPVDHPVFESAREIGNLREFVDKREVSYEGHECDVVVNPSRCMCPGKTAFDKVSVCFKRTAFQRGSIRIEGFRILGPGGRATKFLFPANCPSDRSLFNRSVVTLQLVFPTVITGFSFKTGNDADFDPAHAVLNAFDPKQELWHEIFSGTIEAEPKRLSWSAMYCV